MSAILASPTTPAHTQPEPRGPTLGQGRLPAPATGILVYLLIAFGLAWVLWIPVWLSGLKDTSPLYQGAFWVRAFAPAIGAIVVRRWVTREGFADAGLRPHLRSAWPYYLFAWLWPLLLLGSALALAVVFRLSVLENVSGTIVPSLMTALVAAPLLWCEEFGWRSYLQIRLFSARPLLAAVATGAIWGVWHYPAALAGFIPNGHGMLSLLLIPWFMIAFSIILGWLRLRTGSVWAPVLAHSANNFVIPPLGAVLIAGSPGLGDLLLSTRGLLVVISMVVVCAVIVLSGELQSTTPTATPRERSLPRAFKAA